MRKSSRCSVIMRGTCCCLLTVLLTFLFISTSIGTATANEIVCPHGEDRLYYNIDIHVEATAENCDSYDLEGIGELLQTLVSEVEASIPEYEETEQMTTTVCPLPHEQDVGQARTLLLAVGGNRRLQQVQQTAAATKPKKKRKKRKRYRFKGSGKCRRCKSADSDRRLLGIHRPWHRYLRKKKRGNGRGGGRGGGASTVSKEQVCQYAQQATQSADSVLQVVTEATVKLSALQEGAVECSDVVFGQEMVDEADHWLEAIQKVQHVAEGGAKKATLECSKAGKTKSAKVLKKCFNKARNFANMVDKAAEMATISYNDVQFIVESFWCDTSDAYVEETTSGSSLARNKEIEEEAAVEPIVEDSEQGQEATRPVETTDEEPDETYKVETNDESEYDEGSEEGQEEYNVDGEMEGESPFVYSESGNLDTASPMYQWLSTLADELDKRIPPELLKVYGYSPDRNGCTLEAIFGYVEVESFNEVSEAAYYIEDLDDCNNTVIWQ